MQEKYRVSFDLGACPAQCYDRLEMGDLEDRMTSPIRKGGIRIKLLVCLRGFS